MATSGACSATDRTFEEVWLVHRPAVASYARSLLPRDHHTAQDVVQETATRLWQHPEVLARQGSLRGWLLTVTRNVVIDFQRRRTARLLEVPGLEPGSRDEPVVDDDTDLVAGELATESILDAVSLPQRAALIAVYVDGHTMVETADILGIPLGTVKSRCHHGIRAIRRAASWRS